MPLRVFNTMTRTIEEFVPIREGHAGLYTCGPTVYNYAHIGNLRTYIFEDILRRYFEYLGYQVDHVMNITDVGHLSDDADEGEDKMTLSARQQKRTVWEIAQHYTDAFFEDTDRLNIIRPTVIPRATDHIQDMIDLIRRLEDRGYTYEAGGNIYFDIEKFPDYGKLALLDQQDLQAGARIEVDRNKRNPHDFVLWFTQSKFEHQSMVWDSPWGRGYPGWHIECSAMSMRYLGEQFDIHCGGVDHIPIHHTNEIAQSEAAVGHRWVNYWLHGEFLVMSGGKMSKSRGGFITLQSLVDDGYDPLDYRYFCFGAHYRIQLQFSTEGLDAARSARNNLVQRLRALGGELSPSGLPEEPGNGAERYLRAFEEHLAADLNMPRALSELWGLLKDTDVPAGDRLAAAYRMDRVFGLRLRESVETEQELDSESLGLIEERVRARKERNFRRADEIRDMLSERGILVEDTPEGPKWKRIGK